MNKDGQIERQHGSLRKPRDASASMPNDWFKDLYDYFAPVRAEIIARGIGEDEVNADIVAALQEVRARST
jgi:hypothetical protein